MANNLIEDGVFHNQLFYVNDVEGYSCSGTTFTELVCYQTQGEVGWCRWVVEEGPSELLSRVLQKVVA